MVEFLPGIQYSHYYAQEDTDTGVMMETMVPTKEIKEGLNEFLENGCLRVRILWKTNQQLFQSTYHQYDEIYRFQREQMVQDIHLLRNQGDNCVFEKNSNKALCNSFSVEDDVAECTYEPGVSASHPRGRRISSLGDEMYYTFDSEDMQDTAVDATSSIQHQHSLESYQLNKEKLAKIREKQATMPGWEGLIPPARLCPGASPVSSASSARLDGSQSHLSGSSPKLSGSSPRLSSSPKLNTIQMGLAAVLNPENYIQQQKRKIPFIPGAFMSPWLSKSHDEGLSAPAENMEKTVSSPLIFTAGGEGASAEDLVKVGSSRRPRPRRLLGINKCQSFNC